MPGSGFPEEGSAMKALWRLVRFTSDLRWLYVGIIVAATAVAVANLALPFIIGAATQVVSDGVAGHPHPNAIAVIIWLAVAMLAVEAAKTIVSNIGGYGGDLLGARIREILSNRYYDKLLRLPQSWYDVELTGSIVSRLNRSIATVSTFANLFSNGFFTTLITTVAVLVISALYWWPLAVLLLIIFPVYVWLTALTSKKWQVLEKEKNEEIDLAGGRFAEVVGQMRVVRSFVAEAREYRSFASRFQRTIGITKAQSRHWHKMDVVRVLALNLVFFGLYIIIFLKTLDNTFSIGSMVVLIQLMGMARQPVESMSWIIDTSQRAIAGTVDYFAAMDEPEGERIIEKPRPLPRVTEGETAVEFDGVTFAYDEEPVLRDVSFQVRRGEKIAFVGESGGGKTTIVSLLLDLYPVTKGAIYVDGVDIREVEPAAVRSEIGVVFQDASLFSGTIRENIAYGRPDATDAEVLEAARKANALGFIERFPNGIDELIGERGIKLSGGQRQRIAVARAILKDAPILVLDEATSALDTKAERAVQQGLDALMVGRTSLIIAHRLSTIASVDQIVTLRNGRVDEIGSPDELATSGGIYAELLQLQHSTSAADRKRLKQFGIRV